MANNFVKWWKTKFLNGYRQFSAETNYGKISDTEELLGGNGFHESDSDDRLRAACTTPPIETNSPDHSQKPPSNTSNAQQQHLNLEEFSCDVSVEGGVDRKGQERQEFSFTLYDFDGYGKITKDDIASLVTTIYEALGSSVKVPHYGSKTIRVKLTVSPDQRKHVSATVINDKEKQEEKSESATRLKRDLNVTIRHGNKHCRKPHKRKESRNHHCCESAEVDQEDCLNVSDDSSDVSSNLSGDVTSEEDGECSDHYICNKMRQKKYHKKLNRYTHKENINQQEGCSKNEKGQKRSSSLQRQELLEIIQANMDKNNLGLQSARKQTNSHINIDTKSTPRSELKQHQRRQKSTNLPTLQYLANIMDPTHFYVDLASFQNATQLPNTNCQYNKLIDAVMCVSSKKAPVKRNTGCRKHKIKAHDYTGIPPLRCNILTDSVQNEKTPKKSKTTEVEQTKQFRKNVKRIPQIVLGNTSSPHYLRHRNRQEDQARAMAQVVRWLEQEFSSNFYTNDQNHKTEYRSNSYEKQANNATPSPTSSVERHEHHHVHEHIHHHYHHYQEAPIVV